MQRKENLTSLFAELLGLERANVEDSFFALGEHSALPPRLIGRVRSTLAEELGVRVLFETPAVSGLKEQLHMVREGRSTLRAMPRPEAVPLSFAQQRLWFLHQLEGPSPTYNTPVALRLEGVLNREALAAALADVVERHESLRTLFKQIDGLPVQSVLVQEQTRLGLDVEETTEADLAEALARGAAYCFDLANEIPLRVRLFRLDAQRHVLLLVLHHIANDGWSLAPLARDLAIAYGARQEGNAPNWSPLPVQYADYTLWQRELLGDEEDPDSKISKQLAYWRNALRELPEELELPIDRPRPPAASQRGAIVSFRLGADLHQKLLGLARECQASLFMVLQAGVAALFTRLGGGEDIVLGSPIAGRRDPALDDLIGFFVNTLALRVDTSGNPSFSELIRRARSFDLAAYDNQDLPFERLIEELNPTRSLSRHPLFQVMLTLQNNAEARFNLPGLTVTREVVGSFSSLFDLSLSFAEQRGPKGDPLGLDAYCQYTVDLFDDSTVVGFGERLIRLFEAVVVDPSQRIGSIDILDPAERQKILIEWNDTDSLAPEDTLSTLFERQVVKNPDAIAVVFEDVSVTYSELNARANQFAHYLIGLGVGPEVIVATLVERTLNTVILFLGIMKSGAAYMPIDPSYPIERINMMIDDARPSCVIYGEECDIELCRHTEVEYFDVSSIFLQISAYPDTNPDRDRIDDDAVENAAYVIYTSGSTGRPKGVVVAYHSITNTIFTLGAYLGFCDMTRSALIAAVGSDMTITQMLLPLTRGGTLIVFSERAKIQNFWNYAARFRLNLVNCLPSWINIVLDIPHAQYGIDKICVDGNDFGIALLNKIRRHQPSAIVYNSYGPTETSGSASVFTVGEPDAFGYKPIGRPAENYRFYILDQHLQPVPIGVVGELYIGGKGVARGYLRRPDLTAEKFIENPFIPGDRLYRTGDLVRYRSDGNAVFIARYDHQIKIRGFRIEAGEIEAALIRDPSVAQAVLLAREDLSGQKQLVAYVTGVAGAQLDSSFLRRQLVEQLPDYMVPATIVALDALPLTPNGKVDRQALPAPEFIASGGRVPCTPQEKVLASLFAEVLGLKRVDADVSFFDIGGHSLLAMRLISRIRGTLGVDLGVRALFEAPTVAALSEQLGKTSWPSADSLAPLLPMRLGESNEPAVFFIHPASGLSWCYAGLIRHIPSNRRIYGLQASIGGFQHETIEDLAYDYLAKIRSVQAQGPYHLVGWSLGGCIAHAVATQLRSMNETVATLAILDGYPSDTTTHASYESIDDGELRQPISKESLQSLNEGLGALNGELLEIIKANIMKSKYLLHRFKPTMFDGDVVLFVATKGEKGLQRSVEAWQPYVAGNIHTYEIDCHHDNLTANEPLSKVGQILGSTLGRGGATLATG